MNREEFLDHNRRQTGLAEEANMNDKRWFSSVSHMKSKYVHYFSPETMRFFNSRVLTTLYGTKSRVFVTSESDGENPRRYTVRIAQWNEDDGYSVDTLGDFQAFASATQAKSYAHTVGMLDSKGLLPDYFAYGQSTALARALGVPGAMLSDVGTDGWVFDTNHGFSKEDAS